MFSSRMGRVGVLWLAAVVFVASFAMPAGTASAVQGPATLQLTVKTWDAESAYFDVFAAFMNESYVLIGTVESGDSPQSFNLQQGAGVYALKIEGEGYYREETVADVTSGSGSAVITMKPQTLPKTLHFFDEDHNLGEVGGRFLLHLPETPGDITSYRVYIEDAAGIRLNTDDDPGSITVTDAVYEWMPAAGDYIESEYVALDLPPGAANFRVYAVEGGEEQPTPAYFPIWDMPIRYPFIRFVDEEPQAGLVRGRIELTFPEGESVSAPYEYVIAPIFAGVASEPLFTFVPNGSGTYLSEVFEAPADSPLAFAIRSPRGDVHDGYKTVPLRDYATDLTMPPEPVQPQLPRATDVVFRDFDYNEGSIRGELHWKYEQHETDVSLAGYAVYFVNDEDTPIQSIMHYRFPSPQGYIEEIQIFEDIPFSTSIPEQAAGIAVYLLHRIGDGGGETYEAYGPAGVAPLLDSPTFMPSHVQFIDLDPNAGAHDPLLRWNPANDESKFSAYGIYVRTPNITLVHEVPVDPEAESYELYLNDIPDYTWNWDDIREIGVAPATASAAALYVVNTSDNRAAEPPGDPHPVHPSLAPPQSFHVMRVPAGDGLYELHLSWMYPAQREHLAGFDMYAVDDAGQRKPLGFAGASQYAQAATFILPASADVPQKIAIYSGGWDGGVWKESAEFVMRPVEAGQLYVSFADADFTPGAIGGTVKWETTGDVSHHEYYDIYLADESMEMVGQPLAAHVPASASSRDIPFQTPVAGATYVVVGANGGAELFTAVLVDTTPEHSEHFRWSIREEIVAAEPLNLHLLSRYARMQPHRFQSADAYRVLLELIEPRFVDPLP